MATTSMSTFGGDAYTLGHKASNNAGIDETGSGGMPNSVGEGACMNHVSARLLTDIAVEGRAAKRFQRSISEKNLPVRKPEQSDAARNNLEARPMFGGHQRRQSTRDPKAPPNTAALQSSPSKR